MSTWSLIVSILGDAWKFAQDNMSALGLLLWNFEEARVQSAKAAADKAQTDLQVEKNHESVDQKYSGKSDADIVNDAVINGGGSGGQLETDPGTQPASSVAVTDPNKKDVP